MASARAHGVESLVHLLRLDYRDIPRKSYDRITCLEMAEHVGLKNFQKFLVQVRDMLDDDGIFYIQVAGLRRPWQYEDFIWCPPPPPSSPDPDFTWPLNVDPSQGPLHGQVRLPRRRRVHPPRLVRRAA